MTKRVFKNIGIIVFAGIFLAACSVTKPYESPQVSTEMLYRDVVSDDTTNVAQLPWNVVYTDTYLQGLIRAGLQNNLDILVAAERLEQARLYFEQSGAAFFPTLSGNATGSAARMSEGGRGGQFQLGVTSSWEVDIWGKLKSRKRAALASFLQTEAAERAVRTGLVAGIANAYYTLLALDRQLSITEESVRNWETSVETMRTLKESARVTEAAVVQSEAQRYAAEVTIPDLKQRIRETENGLSILLGEVPQRIERGKLEDQQYTFPMDVGVPAQLLANRPDVQMAEYNFRYNFEMTNVARTYFYPSLTITGGAGIVSSSIENLFQNAPFVGNIGAGLLQPILDQRGNKTRLSVAQSQQREALLNYRDALLTAGKEVSDALFTIGYANEKVAIRSKQVSSLEKSVEYSQELLQNGFATYLEIITARQNLLQAGLGQVNDQLQILLGRVSLYRSLGGGWRSGR